VDDAPSPPPAAAPGLSSPERLVILGALTGVSAVSWLYLVLLTRDMPRMDGGGSLGRMAEMSAMAMPEPWNLTHALLMFVMWWVMMVGMMLPSAAPMLLTFATINRSKRSQQQPYVPTAVFAAGYLVAWGGFSLVATAAQWGLEQAALLSPMMVSTSPVLGGALFLGAGVYQLTPLKYACLKHCRSPFDFVLNRWRDGTRGALQMGVDHGLYCLGCCWVIMALLFVGGVMNLLWCAAIAAFVFVEKLFPAGPWIARVGGVAMAAFGCALLATMR